jgi:Lon protease-like protein
MARNPFTPEFADLPSRLPLFPLPGVAVMPDTQLPLNVFEPRYLQMVFDVLGGHRMIGMIQPLPDSETEERPRLYGTGTAGRISSFSETKDGRLMIVLTGVCRFRILREEDSGADYRIAEVDWTQFAGDYHADPGRIADRPGLFRSLRNYCSHNDVEIAWKDAEGLADQALVDLLTVHLPLQVPEKQALIESAALSDRIALLQGLLEMSNAENGRTTELRH